MEKYQNILAVVDPSEQQQKALDRACTLAKRSGANITALLVIYDFSYEMTTMLSADEREAMRTSVVNDRTLWLSELTEQFDCQIDVKVIWHNRPFEAILAEVRDHQFDIVIKSTHEHPTLQSVIFTPTDWHLIRKCWVPLLLVKDHLWPENGRILAAINAGSEEQEHQSLNNKITDEALNLGKLIKADVHLVNSYPGTPVNIAIEVPEFDAAEYNETMRNHHLEVMKKHASQYHIDAHKLHIEEGLPEDVIESVAEKIDAELVILGTIGRTGLSAVLIGNTAEHVIDRLNCDLLALKPEGYHSPFLD
ncbi:universal stress protein UspE [Thalassotalea ponticola]|uniref:universal stress protein UspE n=1 Tax=Thalassotalea ponticola TaxID=1523392 RepID=UPI0025B2DE22|nr:universal stress protein UspE [Thalassotalea ponticola]MDN3651226.1 universal stress protein UspE [Thalassotalea ponticola]